MAPMKESMMTHARGWTSAMLIAAACAVLATQTTLSGTSSRPAPADWELVVLGIAQDAGIPQLSCLEQRCSDIRAGRRKAEKVASVGVVDRVSGQAFLFDATPDMHAQIHALTGGRLPDGIFLTHAHIGHYTGLMYLGKESTAAKGVPVYATRRMSDFLAANGPWSLLVKDGHIAVRVVTTGTEASIGGELTVTPIQVPHRDEFTDTVGYIIQGPRARVFFVPDTDRWETWTRSIRELADQMDVLLVDGTFASASELKGRKIEEIPHPLMSATRALLRGTRAKLWFIHLNHTNTELDTAADVVKEGQRFPI
jgi:pyrroloquinoline quinone biosynthesis protein B